MDFPRFFQKNFSRIGWLGFSVLQPFRDRNKNGRHQSSRQSKPAEVEAKEKHFNSLSEHNSRTETD